MSTNTQATWDAEDLHRFRRKVVGLATEAGDLLAREAEARAAWREKRKARREASAELAEWVNTPRPELPDAAFAGEARRLTDLVVDLEQEERSSLSSWKVVSARRRRAQLELQTTVRAWTAPVPLFDAPKEEPPPRSCRVCGCTDDNCADCIEKTGLPCHWIEEDLCSACVPEGEPVIEKDFEKVLEQEAEADRREKEYRFEDVGCTVKQLDAAYVGALFAGKTHAQPPRVHPVKIDGRLWVCFSVLSDRDLVETWNLLPLRSLDEGVFLEEDLRSTPARGERGYYFGVVVRVNNGNQATHAFWDESEIIHVRKDNTPKEPEAAYAWEMVVRLRDGREETVTYAAKTQTKAWRKAMARPNAAEVLSAEPMTREQYVRVKGTRRARL
jgi:hypothetical protein